MFISYSAISLLCLLYLCFFYIAALFAKSYLYNLLLDTDSTTDHLKHAYSPFSSSPCYTPQTSRPSFPKLFLPDHIYKVCTAVEKMLAHMANMTSKHLARRKLTRGAQAGIGIAVALVALIAIGITVFVIVRRRRAKRLDDLEKERAQLAGEMKKKEEEPKPLPKRNKSIKDRLKGPLYQDTFDMPPVKQKMEADGTPGSPQWDDVDGQGSNHKPWAENSPRPSFSSRRGTRMMMMM